MATNEEAMKSLVTSADVAVIVIFIALATAAVILRIWAQSINKKAGGLDDIAIILALVILTICICCLSALLIHTGVLLRLVDYIDSCCSWWWTQYNSY